VLRTRQPKSTRCARASITCVGGGADKASSCARPWNPPPRPPTRRRLAPPPRSRYAVAPRAHGKDANGARGPGGGASRPAAVACWPASAASGSAGRMRRLPGRRGAPRNQRPEKQKHRAPLRPPRKAKATATATATARAARGKPRAGPLRGPSYAAAAGLPSKAIVSTPVKPARARRAARSGQRARAPLRRVPA
jgi:hypothetical protein